MMSTAQGHALTVVKQLRQKKYKTEIVKTLPGSIPEERFFRMAATELARDPKFARCTPESLMAAVIEASHMGLCFDSVLGHAYIIPYGNEAKFQLGYKGYIVLAQRSGRVNHVDTAVRYEGDAFEYRFGTRSFLDHTPEDDGQKRGEMRGAWCKVTYVNGLQSFDYMPRVDIETIRCNAPGSKRRDSPWNTHTGEMYRKTVMIRHLKTRGISPEITRYATQEEIYHSGSWQTDEQRAEEAKEVEAEIIEQEKFGETMANGQDIKPVESESESVADGPPALTTSQRQDLYVEHQTLSRSLGRKQMPLDRMEDRTLIEAVEMLRKQVAEEAAGQEEVPIGDENPFLD
jgi:recombination protein RecT